MLNRILNLWAWSKYSPQSPPIAMKETFEDQKAQIIYPNRVEEILQANPEASLDDLIQ